MHPSVTRAQEILGHQFADAGLLECALTHASTSENGLSSNERLEFLGDAVLGLVVCDLIFRRFPTLREGDMTKIKSLVVSRDTCAHIARDLGIEPLLILGKGMKNNGSLPPSISACALESLIGALHLDAGFEAVRRFVAPLIERAALSGHQQNFKSVLQQYAQQNLGCPPAYRVLDEQGPDHCKCFKVRVELGGRIFEPCWGQTKKRAEQEAALAALRELGLVTATESGEPRLALSVADRKAGNGTGHAARSGAAADMGSADR
jgi:ribonuclease III